MDIAESCRAIREQKNAVAKQFYDRFFARHPNVRALFQRTNMQHQHALLRMALVIIDEYYRSRFPAAEEYLKVLGYRHHRLGVEAGDYEKWRHCLLDTLAEFHAEDWTPELAAQWEDAVNLAVATMLEGYSRDSAQI